MLVRVRALAVTVVSETIWLVVGGGIDQRGVPPARHYILSAESFREDQTQYAPRGPQSRRTRALILLRRTESNNEKHSLRFLRVPALKVVVDQGSPHEDGR